jgi:hypothetical protein
VVVVLWCVCCVVFGWCLFCAFFLWPALRVPRRKPG